VMNLLRRELGQRARREEYGHLRGSRVPQWDRYLRDGEGVIRAVNMAQVDSLWERLGRSIGLAKRRTEWIALPPQIAAPSRRSGAAGNTQSQRRLSKWWRTPSDICVSN
jgi:hypothetical protein